MDKGYLKLYSKSHASSTLLYYCFMRLHIYGSLYLHVQHSKPNAIPNIQVVNAINCINIVYLHNRLKLHNKIHILSKLSKYFFLFMTQTSQTCINFLSYAYLMKILPFQTFQYHHPLHLEDIIQLPYKYWNGMINLNHSHLKQVHKDLR